MNLALLALSIPLALAPTQGTLPDGPLAWNGQAHAGTGDAVLHLHDGPPVASEILSRCAATRAAYLVERDPAGAAEGLEREWILASSATPFEHQADALVQIALLRAELLRAQGRAESARAALEHVLPDGGDARWQRWAAVLVPAPPALLAVVEEAERDPRLVEARRAAAAAPDPGAAEDDLRAAVREASERPNRDTLRQIGWRAAPFLLERVLETADSFGPGRIDADPVFQLLELDPRRGSELLREPVASHGYPLAWRALRAIRRDGAGGHEFLEGSLGWVETSEGEYVGLLPEMIVLLEDLLERPDASRECLDALRPVVTHGGLTPRLVEALGSYLAGGSLANPVLLLLDNGTRDPYPGTARVYERGLVNPDRVVRRVCARRLLETPQSVLLRGHADDPDAEVRLAVATALRQPPFDEAARAAAVRLLADEDPRVRYETLDAVRGNTPPLDAEVFERLLDDPAPEIRAGLIQVTSLGPAIQGHLLSELADDPLVAPHVASWLARGQWTDDPAAFLPALERCWRLMRAKDLHLIAQASEVRNALVTWMLEENDPRLIRDFAQGESGGASLSLDDATFARWLARVAAVDYERGRFWLSQIKGMGYTRPKLARFVAEPGAPADLRLLAAGVVAVDGGEEFRASVLQILRDPAWVGVTPVGEIKQALDEVGKGLPPNEVNPLLLEVARDERIPEPFAAELLPWMRDDRPGAREVMHAVLARWLGPDAAPFPPVEKALDVLRAFPADADPALFERAVRQPIYAETAVETMGVLRDPRFLPLLERCLSADWVVDDIDRRDVGIEAARALSAYLSEEAAELLLRGLGSADPDVADECEAGLESFYAYQDRVGRWRTRREAGASRESALEEVIALLQSAKAGSLVRAQAARSLATLGSEAQIPLLLRLLDQDGDRTVREAVLEALDRLNRVRALEREGEGESEEAAGDEPAPESAGG